MLRNLFYISILIFNIKLIAQTPPVINSHITSGLLLHLDAGNSSSYSGSGNTWNDLSSSGNNGTNNGATFNSTNKSFDFDGTNDYVGLSAVLSQGQAEYTTTGTYSWIAPAGVKGITDYRIEYSKDFHGPWTTFSHTASDEVTDVVDGLDDSTKYYFRVAAENYSGTGKYSAVASASTT